MFFIVYFIFTKPLNIADGICFVFVFRLLDLGFEKAVSQIVSEMDAASQRQTVLLSATLSSGGSPSFLSLG